MDYWFGLAGLVTAVWVGLTLFTAHRLGKRTVTKE